MGARQKLLRPDVALVLRSGLEQELRLVLRDEPNDVLLLGVVGCLFDDGTVDQDWRVRSFRLLKVVRILKEAKDLSAKDRVVSLPRSECGSLSAGGVLLLAIEVVFDGDGRHAQRVKLPLVGLTKAATGVEPWNGRFVLWS